MTSPFRFDQSTNCFNLQRLLTSKVPMDISSTKENQTNNNNNNFCNNNSKITPHTENYQFITDNNSNMDSPISNSSSDEDVDIDLIMETKPSLTTKSLSLNCTNAEQNTSFFSERNFPSSPFQSMGSGSRSSSRSNTPQKFSFAKPISTQSSEKFLRIDSKKKLKNFVKFQQSRNLRIQLPSRRSVITEKLNCPGTPESEKSTGSFMNLFYHKPTSS